ncbi:MAG: mechanosensitive ion channel, partial [Calditrichaeota bacterium]|nr:mechanosensitive ion channel [Calditrichota bacterium]
TNLTRFPIVRLDLPVGVAYREELPRVRQLLLEIVRESSWILESPEPQVHIQAFGSSSIDLLLWCWVTRDDWWEARTALIEAVKTRFDAEGIEIPFPHVSLYAGSASDPLTVKVVNKES